MKPYAFRGDGTDSTGCCPGHDWPRLYRWAGRYSSSNSRRADKRANQIAKRARRRTDKIRSYIAG